MAIVDERAGYVNMQGEVTCPIQFNAKNMEILGSSFFVMDFDGSYYIIAADGTQTKVDFRELRSFPNASGGRLVVARNADDKWGLVDWHGNTVSLFIHSSAYAFTFSPSGEYILIPNEDGVPVVYKIDYCFGSEKYTKR